MTCIPLRHIYFNRKLLSEFYCCHFSYITEKMGSKQRFVLARRGNQNSGGVLIDQYLGHRFTRRKLRDEEVICLLNDFRLIVKPSCTLHPKR